MTFVLEQAEGAPPQLAEIKRQIVDTCSGGLGHYVTSKTGTRVKFGEARTKLTDAMLHVNKVLTSLWEQSKEIDLRYVGRVDK